MTNYKETVIRNYYNNLQNHLAAIDALEIKDAMKFIEESLVEIQSVSQELERIEKSANISPMLKESTHLRLKQLLEDVEIKRLQLSQVVTKRIEFLKSFPDIEELLNDVKE